MLFVITDRFLQKDGERKTDCFKRKQGMLVMRDLLLVHTERCEYINNIKYFSQMTVDVNKGEITNTS